MLTLPPSAAIMTIGAGDAILASITAKLASMLLLPSLPLLLLPDDCAVWPVTVNCTGPAVLLVPVLSTTLRVTTYMPRGSRMVVLTPVAVAWGVPSLADLTTQPYATCSG
jgi:hypothetical protein